MSSFIGTRKQFIDKYGPFIVQQTKGTGILPGTLITQLIVESSGKYNGKFLVGGSTLSRNAQNYFGIKCGSNWKGAKYDIKTREEDKNGNSYYITACFRKYPGIEQSIQNYIQFLRGNKRYANAGLFQEKTVIGQFEALKRAGYATGSGYVKLLTDVYIPLKKDIDAIPTTARADLGLIVPIVALFSGIVYFWKNL
jgi:flagellum-specific peptidoglycan hydrolase FlgJ